MGLRVRFPWEGPDAGVVLDGQGAGCPMPGAPSAVFDLSASASDDPRRVAMDAMVGQLREQGVTPERANSIAHKAAVRHEQNNPR